MTAKTSPVHLCGPLSLDRTCRQYGVSRIFVRVGRWTTTFAYWPTSWWPNKTLNIEDAELIE